MDLALTESQEMLKVAARSFMEREASTDVIVGMQRAASDPPRELWRKASELGWLGILVPPEYGGSGESFSTAAVLYEELGRGPMPGPFFSSGALGVLAVMESATAEQRRQILPAVARGERVLSVAITEPNTSWGPAGVTLTPQRRQGAYMLNGTKLFVSDATAATDLIVAVRIGEGPGDVGLLHVDAGARGVSTRRLPGFIWDQCEVTFEDVEVPAAALLGGREQQSWATLARALERALPLLCAYIVGGCQAVFEKSVAHTQNRVQFGVPIGRFQRVQDHVVRLVNHLDSARWATWEALWKVDTGRAAAASVHLAKAVASEGYLEACNAAHEIHAGMGVLMEYGLAAHTQMSRTLYAYLGDPRWHKRRMADALEW
ncbi:MAG TPA: acyl-CoA dehydrogenase family protein [Candidatus Methylomirabilis sp.]|nr:acyl-CoA dehydrogenase family protein [Candidatus Methylomirabilis sp.]